ncbi:MAG: PKD domain-containing protein [Candidatus Omnitrophica bacterium]|nr:PKD domain-containing protein [Candidatus Omnitrophota bacterium]
MKKISFLLIFAFLLSGCATYKFQHGAVPYDKGYVVNRDGDTLPDYTIGKNNTVPADLALAKKRFKERRDTVEHYYTQMGLLENPAKQWLEPPVLVFKLLTGFLRLPFIAYKNYKYEHDPKYKAEVDKLDEAAEAKESQRIKILKEELNLYIQKELEKEPSFAEVPQEEAQANKKVTVSEVTAQEPAKEAPKPAQEVTPVVEEKPAQAPAVEPIKEPVKEEPVVEQPVSVAQPEEKAAPVVEQAASKTSEGIKAVIDAKPLKGYSPLRVKFSGSRSRSEHGRIISYFWDFGDGDTSNKPTPANIYWSATYGSRAFAVTLTVKDNKGNTATQTAVIEVLNK